MERVIFRKERNPYVQSIRCTNQKKGESWNETLCNPEYNYLAIFPDDEARPGQIACVPFFFDGYGNVRFEPYCEIGLAYYYQQTSIVHKTSQESEKLLDAIERYYDTKFKIVEKITH